MTNLPMSPYRVEDLPNHIRSGIQVNPLTGCWEWQRGREERGGYGRIRVGSKVTVVHRVVWEILVGTIPPGHQINHVKSRGCRTNACCWPEHLEAVQQGAGRRARICDHAVDAGDLHVTLPPELARALAASGQPIHLHFHLGG